MNELHTDNLQVQLSRISCAEQVKHTCMRVRTRARLLHAFLVSLCSSRTSCRTPYQNSLVLQPIVKVAFGRLMTVDLHQKRGYCHAYRADDKRLVIRIHILNEHLRLMRKRKRLRNR